LSIILFSTSFFLMPEHPQSPSPIFQNLIAFWVLGMCNNFAYVIMLSAAKDILSAQQGRPTANDSSDDTCQTRIVHRDCPPISTGSVLLADILPALAVKVLTPFFMYRIPFGVRHLIVVLLQCGSFIVVANSTSVTLGLIGVVIASAGSGLGEVTYLSLASYFPSRVVTAWSSGTGGAGILGAFAYASLTDSHMLAMSPRAALLTMLCVPAIFAFTYWRVLMPPSTVHRVILAHPFRYRVPNNEMSRNRLRLFGDDDDEDSRLLGNNSEDDERPGTDSSHDTHNFSFKQKLSIAKLLLRFMIPLSVVYFAEYFINQGLVELLVFDCSHGFSLSRSSQYRWYQVLYQIGVFISRSSIEYFSIPPSFLPLLPILQLMNAAFFFTDTMDQFVPHISIIFALVFVEGLLGGCAYVNTFCAIHKSMPRRGNSVWVLRRCLTRLASFWLAFLQYQHIIIFVVIPDSVYFH
uniref:Battenin n=1 Tax=Parascaris univalens TaxID=6257 RepID=A0A915B0H1_PARUN